MKLARAGVVEGLHSFVEAGNGVVIGAPGVGKTFLLKELARAKHDDPNAYCFFVPVDKLPEVSEASLSSSLGVTTGLFEFLESDAETKASAFFVVDALDAVRSDGGRRELMNLLRRARAQLSAKWRLIASVRTFDALRSAELDLIFDQPDQDGPTAFRLPGVVCRHFFVPELTEAEIQQAVGSVQGLDQDWWDKASDELRPILKTPFALWLLERIVESGGVEDLTGLRSETELLGLFWRLRVESGDGGIQSRLILERLANALLDEQRLSIPTSVVYRGDEQAAWHDLHSAEILLTETSGPTRTAFAHNILFDYAVSVLLMDPAPEALKRFLEDDPSRALFLRPSLNYFFIRLWHLDRDAFWNTFFSVATSSETQLRLFMRVLPPTIVASEAAARTDLDPLFGFLDSGARIANENVQHLLRAARFAGFVHADVWAAACADLVERISNEFVWDLALALDALSRTDARETVQTAARAARSMLRWAFHERPGNPTADRVGATWLVPLVARTSATDPVDAADVLAQVVRDVGDPQVSVDYAYRLASELKSVWAPCPEVAASLFRAAFERSESSDERTHLGGIVLSLTSTRKQDFDMLRWTLKSAAPAFLRECPDHALPALVDALQVRIGQERLITAGSPSTSSFAFLGEEARFTPDGSEYWDAVGTVADDPQELAAAITEWIDSHRTAEPQKDARGALRRLGRYASTAFIWRRLLLLGAGHPEFYAVLLADVVVAEPVLAAPETVREAAEFIGAAASRLSQPTYRLIEERAVEIANKEEDPHRSLVTRVIAKIPEARLSTEAGRALWSQVADSPEIRANRPLVEISSYSQAYTEATWLAEEGVDMTDPVAIELTDAGAPLTKFIESYTNTKPDTAAIVEILPSFESALALIDGGSEAHGLLLDSTWAKVGGVARILARSHSELDARAFERVRETLLRCASGNAPAEDAIHGFTMPAWSPAARNEAAQGLPLIAAPNDLEVAHALRDLSTDPVTSVRWLLAASLWCLGSSTPDLFWELAHHYAHDEPNALVLDALSNSLGRVADRAREPRVQAVLTDLLARPDLAGSDPRASDIQNHTSSLIAGLAIGRGNEWALGVMVASLGGLPTESRNVLGYVTYVLQFLHVDRVDAPDFAEPAERALAWLTRCVTEVAAAIRGTGDVSQLDLKSMYDVIDQVVSRLYFNSGAYVGPNTTPPPSGAMTRFFSVTEGLVGVLAAEVGGPSGIGIPASTAHHFIQLLHAMLPTGPATVIHEVREVVVGASRAGYAFDAMASREVTQIVEELLADHREVVRAGQGLADLTTLLDMFVSAGWPEAQQLVFRLEEIFR
jgi:hypothetical protein